MSKTFKKNRTKFDDDYLDYNDESNRNRDKQKWKIERRKQSRRDNMISDKFDDSDGDNNGNEKDYI
tara:strand:- start:1409 stop:1606 length:198 start_codon:yes stop_codon:yes gene_type:complete